jgi:hypothetical protein
LPAVNDVANKVDLIGFVVTQEAQQLFGLAESLLTIWESALFS